MKIVFCGTPAFAVPTLEALLAVGHNVPLVVTQPDRAAGRGMAMQLSPVKALAQARGLAVAQPEKIKNNLEFRAQLEAIVPDAIVVVAYGRIIPDWMLALPPFGNINLHGSLLPKYRGAAPIQWAVANGETHTGVTTMLLEAGLDTGPMLLAQVIPIGSEETAEDVFDGLASVGADLMVRTLAGLQDGSVRPVAQHHDAATHAPILRREDGLVDFNRTADNIWNRWRGFQPWPGAWTTLRGKKLILSRIRVSSGQLTGHPSGAEPGTLHVADGALLAACGGGTCLAIEELQMEGKRRLVAAEFLRGFQVKPGERLGA